MSTPAQDVPCPSTQFIDFVPTQECAELLVHQVGHGLVFGNVVKCISTDTYALAKADTPADAEVAGIVAKVVDANNFFLHVIGDLEGFTGLIPATVYFLSDTTAGQLTIVEPTTIGYVSKPLFISHSATGGLFFNFRGMVLEGASILPDSGVTPGTYNPAQITVNAQGIVTSAGVATGFGTGTVTNVGVTSPLSVINPTTTPTISISLADTSTDGYLSSTDWNIFNSKQATLALGNLTDAGTDGIVVTGGTGAVVGAGTSLAQHVADVSHNGYLSSADWSTFNSKQAALTIGDLTDAGTDGITITGGTGSVIGAGTSLAQHVADATHNGYLSSTDWNTFNTAAGMPPYRTVTFVVDGGGVVLTSGTKNPIKVPFGGTLQGWTMMCSPSGSVTADVYRAANSAGLPVTSIVGGGGTKPAIATNVENSSTSFTGWTSTTITAKDNLAINLSGIATSTYCELTLYYM